MRGAAVDCAGFRELIAVSRVERVLLMLMWVAAPAESLVPQQRWAADYELEWRAPQGCPEVEDIRAKIDAMSERQADAAGTLVVQAQVREVSDGFELALRTEFEGQADERTLSAASCVELADSTALVVSLSLDPHARLMEDAEPEPQQPLVLERQADDVDPPVRREPTPPPREVTAREPAADSNLRWRPRAWGVRLAPFLEVGVLPQWSAGPSVAALALWDRWSLEVSGSLEWGRPTARRSGARGRMQLGAGAVRGCWRARTKTRVEFPLCGVLEAGRVRAVSEGLSPATTVHFAHLAPGAGAGVAVRGERLGLVLGAEALLPVLRAAVLVGEDQVFTTRAASLRAILGLEIFFGTDPT